jgi:hypothetical protein
MATITPRQAEMQALYAPATPPADAAWRIDAAGFLQLKDSATGQFRSAFLVDGQITAGPAED